MDKPTTVRRGVRPDDVGTVVKALAAEGYLTVVRPRADDDPGSDDEVELEIRVLPGQAADQAEAIERVDAVFRNLDVDARRIGHGTVIQGGTPEHRWIQLYLGPYALPKVLAADFADLDQARTRVANSLGVEASRITVEPTEVADLMGTAVNLLGLPFLSFVLGYTPDEITTALSGDGQLSEDAGEGLQELLAVAGYVSLTAKGAHHAYMLLAHQLLVTTDERRPSPASRIRATIEGTGATFASPNDPKAVLDLLAVEAYGAIQLAQAPAFPTRNQFALKSMLSVIAAQSCLAQQFERLALDDDRLAELLVVPEAESNSGRRGAIALSTGSGTMVRSSDLPGQVLEQASVRLLLSGEGDRGKFVDFVRQAYDDFCRLVAGETVQLPAYLTLEGVRLHPGITEVSTPVGVLRVRDTTRVPFLDRPSSLMLEMPVAVDAIVGADLDDLTIPRHGGPDSPNRKITATTDLVAMAILLAAPTDALPGPVVTEWMVLTPTGTPSRVLPRVDAGRVAEIRGSWSSEIGEMVRALQRCDLTDVEVAIRRILSSAREVDDPEDGLIDAVIAWENLIGSRGEQRFRISGAMSRLLASNRRDRNDVFDRAKRLYDLRSSVVHGDEIARPEAQEAHRDALALALDCLRVIVRDRPGLLSEKDRNRAIFFEDSGALLEGER